MLIGTDDNGFNHPRGSEITPQAVYAQRRQWLRAMAAGAAGSTLAGWAGRDALAALQRPAKLAALPGQPSQVAGANTLETLTAYADATQYNNYYEFGLEKSDPAHNAHTLKTKPWSVIVEGLVAKPATFGVEELLKLSAQEERIYRLRCVEGWSMVIPWVGLLARAIAAPRAAAGQR